MSGGDGRDAGNSGLGHSGGKPSGGIKGSSARGGKSGNKGGKGGGANVGPGGSMDIDMGNGMTMHVDGAHAVSPGKGSGAPWRGDSGRGNGGGRSGTKSRKRAREKAQADAKARAEAQEKARRKQAEWEASHPVDVAEQKVQQAEASVNQKQAALNAVKNTPEGLLLANPERHPVSYETRGYCTVPGSPSYTLYLGPFEIRTRAELEKLLTQGGRSFDPMPEGVDPKQTSGDGYEVAMAIRKQMIEEYENLRRRILNRKNQIAAAQQALDLVNRAKADAERNLNAVRQKEAEKNREKADAEAKARLFAKVGITPAPAIWTPQMLSEASAVLNAPDAIALGQQPGSVQLAMTGAGTWTAAGGAADSMAGWFRKAFSRLSVPAVSPLLLRISLGSLWFHSQQAGESSQSDIDRQTGRNWDAVFALNAQHLAGLEGKIEPGAASVDLPIRGQLRSGDGQLTLQLLKTGKGALPAAVPVLSAVRDAATGLDKIALPAVAGRSARTILVNPAPAPAVPQHTGNQTPVPVTPVHTGSEVKPVELPLTTATPAADPDGFRDFIYWRPDAQGTGVEPVYVMLSGPYGETNAKGKYSGRDYNTDNAGGPILDLDWKTARIDRAGVDKVKLHTGRFESSPENIVMIDRLEKILKGELQATDIDKRFYTHKVRELERYRNLGVKDGELPVNYDEVWNNTHTATLEDYKVNEKKQPLYTPEAEEAYRNVEEGK